MGHQVNYYMTPKDFDEFVIKLHKEVPFAILCDRSTNEKPRVLDDFNVYEEDKPWLFFYLVRPGDLDDVVTRHIPGQGHWVLDAVKSPIIEFDRCYFDGRVLRRARQYYVDGYDGPDGRWIQKGEGFRTWAKSILSRTRRWLKKTETGSYIGPDAAAWAAAGGQLVQL